MLSSNAAIIDLPLDSAKLQEAAARCLSGMRDMGGCELIQGFLLLLFESVGVVPCGVINYYSKYGCVF